MRPEIFVAAVLVAILAPVGVVLLIGRVVIDARARRLRDRSLARRRHMISHGGYR